MDNETQQLQPQSDSTRNDTSVESPYSDLRESPFQGDHEILPEDHQVMRAYSAALTAFQHRELGWSGFSVRQGA